MKPATLSDAIGGHLPAGEMTSLGLAKIAIRNGTPHAITPAEWCRRFRAMADRLNVGPAENSAPCYRCEGAGWIAVHETDEQGARLCEVCEGVGRTSPSAPITCPVCHDTRVVRSGATKFGDPMFGKAVDCPACSGMVRRVPPAYTRDVVLQQADVPPGYRGFTIDSYMARDLSPSQIDAAATLGAFATEPDIWRTQHGGRRMIVLSGGVGVGKTGLAIGAVGEALEWAPEPRFVSWLALLSRIGGTYADRTIGSRHGILEDLRRTWLLVLDDFGTSGRPASDHAAAIAEELIEARTAGDRWTILTTNLDQAGIEAEFGARVASRLDGAAVWTVLDGADERRRVREAVLELDALAVGS